MGNKKDWDKLILKKKIAVLLGGISAERNVSLKTGKYVSKSLKKQGYQVKEIKVTANKKNLIKEMMLKSGLRCEILTSGKISVGDQIVIK